MGMAAVLLVSVGLSGCGAKGDPSDPYDMSYEMDSVLNPLGEFPICKEKQTLKLMMSSRHTGCGLRDQCLYPGDGGKGEC